ncbi:hypothetical protein KY306_01065 [Candidatus Woesearchaeota archaeon]|nr:hypothetical protein [Candidatus Woesearchaeota archaeon]
MGDKFQFNGLFEAAEEVSRVLEEEHGVTVLPNKIIKHYRGVYDSNEVFFKDTISAMVKELKGLSDQHTRIRLRENQSPAIVPRKGLEELDEIISSNSPKEPGTGILEETFKEEQGPSVDLQEVVRLFSESGIPNLSAEQQPFEIVAGVIQFLRDQGEVKYNIIRQGLNTRLGISIEPQDEPAKVLFQFLDYVDEKTETGRKMLRVFELYDETRTFSESIVTDRDREKVQPQLDKKISELKKILAEMPQEFAQNITTRFNNAERVKKDRKDKTIRLTRAQINQQEIEIIDRLKEKYVDQSGIGDAKNLIELVPRLEQIIDSKQTIQNQKSKIIIQELEDLKKQQESLLTNPDFVAKVAQALGKKQIKPEELPEAFLDYIGQLQHEVSSLERKLTIADPKHEIADSTKEFMAKLGAERTRRYNYENIQERLVTPGKAVEEFYNLYGIEEFQENNGKSAVRRLTEEDLIKFLRFHSRTEEVKRRKREEEEISQGKKKESEREHWDDEKTRMMKNGVVSIEGKEGKKEYFIHLQDARKCLDDFNEEDQVRIVGINHKEKTRLEQEEEARYKSQLENIASKVNLAFQRIDGKDITAEFIQDHFENTSAYYYLIKDLDIGEVFSLITEDPASYGLEKIQHLPVQSAAPKKKIGWIRKTAIGAGMLVIAAACTVSGLAVYDAATDSNLLKKGFAGAKGKLSELVLKIKGEKTKSEPAPYQTKLEKKKHPDETDREYIIGQASNLDDSINALDKTKNNFEEEYGRLEQDIQKLKKEAEKTVGGDGDPDDDNKAVKALEDRLAAKKMQRNDYVLALEIKSKTKEIETLPLENLAIIEEDLSIFRKYLEDIRDKVSPQSESGQIYAEAQHLLANKSALLQSAISQKEKQREQAIQTLTEEINSIIQEGAYAQPEFSLDSYRARVKELDNPELALEALHNLESTITVYGQQKEQGQEIEKQAQELYEKIVALNLDNNYEGMKEFLRNFEDLRKGLDATPLYPGDNESVNLVRRIINEKVDEREQNTQIINDQIKALKKEYQSNQTSYQTLQQEILEAAESNTAVPAEKFDQLEKYEKLIKELETRLQERETKLKLLN